VTDRDQLYVQHIIDAIGRIERFTVEDLAAVKIRLRNPSGEKT